MATTTEKKASAEKQVPASPLPVLATVDLVPFPAVMMSLYVDRPIDIQAVEAAAHSDGLIFIVAQRQPDKLQPSGRDLFRLGVVANLVRCLQLADGRRKVMLQGLMRARVQQIKRENGLLFATVAAIPLKGLSDSSLAAVEQMHRLRENLQKLVEFEHLPEEMLLLTEEVKDPGVLADLIVAHFKLEAEYAQEILEELDPLKRLACAEKIVNDDLNQFILAERIRGKTEEELNKGQREYYLREQLRQIQQELGEDNIGSEDLGGLREALQRAKLSKEAAAEAERQLSRLERMHPETSEYAMLRTYLEWLSDLPWAKRTKDRLDLSQAKKVLDEDHYSLQKAKDRILEYLSVRKLKQDSQGPILCLVGPPGVGKTSLGRSIARCLNRKFMRMSLGGVRDEAEIRGHRRTYVGALPGRIMQGIKEAGSSNPVFLLDELDKIGSDFRGDPAAALLEILDPEQNANFRDHYINLPFDLSRCLFIATANTVDPIPGALLDRLELIYLSGYTTAEKVKIAQRFLIPRQIREQGLSRWQLSFSTTALTFLIERYTREAGVRNLQREIGALCRKLAREVVEQRKIPKKVDEALIQKLLGITKYDPEFTEVAALAGLARGLAWTAHGGEVMPVEASVAPGKGRLILTGQLGDIMQESAQAAMFYARANAKELGLPATFPDKVDVHIHVPSGAVPKDGPSAGITMATALVSALIGRPVAPDLAMTGEITLRGSVLPVGGLKEKALAALRQGLTRVIIPRENLKDLEEMPKDQMGRLEFIPVRQVGEVLKLALMKGRRAGAHKTVAARKSKVIKRPLLLER